jgi:alkanesulfonate monooxygenase SsuD/methylene tetrahydromethanopterin reductase-like flavin-dependent oxidoreductase (luciferase family)
MREEFEAIGAPPFDERGAVSDEYIGAFKELWTSDNPTFKGKYCSFSDITFLPKPVQKPHPPIWIGGESPPALRRAARLGDAWFPIGTNPRFPVGTMPQIAEYYARVRRYAQDAGRDSAEVGLVYRAAWSDPGDAQTHVDGGRRILTGSAEQIAGDIVEIQELGASRLILDFPGDSVSQVLDRMEQFTTRVKPLAV